MHVAALLAVLWKGRRGMKLAVKGSMDLIAICESVYGNSVGRNNNTDNISKLMSGVDNLHLLGHEHSSCGRAL